ncbi:hypothetical protein SALBM217S_00910 [Streptomyces griseoloalbus]
MQTAVTHAPDDVALALAVPGERQADWEWGEWLPHVLDPGAHDGPVPARRIAPDPRQLAGGLRHELGRRAVYAAEVRRGLADRNALRLASRMLVIVDGHGEPAVELPRPDSAVGPADMGVTVVHLLEEQVHEPDEVSVRITVHGDRVTVENLRATVATQPSADGLGSAVAEGTVDPVAPSFAEGVARMLAPLRLSPESVAGRTLSPGRSTSLCFSASRTPPTSTCPSCGSHAPNGTSCACRSVSRTATNRCCWT